MMAVSFLSCCYLLSLLTHQAEAQVLGSSSSSSETSSPAGLGGAVLAGLGVSSTATTSASSDTVQLPKNNTKLLQSATSSPSPRTITSAATLATDDCQAQLVSWSSSVASILTFYATNSTSTWFNTTATGCSMTRFGSVPYTTMDGFAHIQGNYTSTRADCNVTGTVISTSWYPNIITSSYRPADVHVPPRPSCTIAPKACTSLYSAYASSLGVTSPYGELPFIFPAPTNSPRCTTNRTECYTSTYMDACYVQAAQVQVFYWPDFVPSATNKRVHPRTTVISNITMTSPTVYLSFSHMQALSTTLQNMYCPDFTLRGLYDTATNVGPVYTEVWASYFPTDLSTLEMEYYTAGTVTPYPDSLISVLANPRHSRYGLLIRELWVLFGAATPKTIDYQSITRPNARAYYLAPLYWFFYRPNCDLLGQNSGCNTIWDDQYNPILSIPPDLYKLAPEWSSCLPGLYGVFDPPRALDPADDAATITTVTQPVQTSTAASPASSADAHSAKATNADSIPVAADHTPTAAAATSTLQGQTPGPTPTSDDPPAGQAVSAHQTGASSSSEGKNEPQTRASLPTELRPQVEPWSSPILTNSKDTDSPSERHSEHPHLVTTPALASNALQALTLDPLQIHTRTLDLVSTMNQASSTTTTMSSKGISSTKSLYDDVDGSVGDPTRKTEVQPSAQTHTSVIADRLSLASDTLAISGAQARTSTQDTGGQASAIIAAIGEAGSVRPSVLSIIVPLVLLLAT